MQKKVRILIVDDTQSFRFLLRNYLTDAGYQATCVASGAEALSELAENPYDMVLSDMVMPEMDGVELLRQTISLYPQLIFVLITAHGSIDSAVAAMKEGAGDYLLKPLNFEELLIVVTRLLKTAQLQASYARMLASEQKKFSFQNMLSLSPIMGTLLALAQQVAFSPRTTVSIFGESGVGKGSSGSRDSYRLETGHDPLCRG